MTKEPHPLCSQPCAASAICLQVAVMGRIWQKGAKSANAVLRGFGLGNGRWSTRKRHWHTDVSYRVHAHLKFPPSSVHSPTGKATIGPKLFSVSGCLCEPCYNSRPSLALRTAPRWATIYNAKPQKTYFSSCSNTSLSRKFSRLAWFVMPAHCCDSLFIVLSRRHASKPPVLGQPNNSGHTCGAAMFSHRTYSLAVKSYTWIV